MNTTRSRFALVLGSLVALSGCAATSHPAAPASLGTSASGSALEAVVDLPGPLTVETIAAGDWEVPRSGLINLDDPKAKAAHLADGPEPIKIFVHAIHHPTKGLFLIDTGVERAFASDPDHALVHGVFGSLAHVDKLKVHVDTASLVAREGEPVKGVFLTHLHLDHIMGLRDLPASTPVFVGVGDAEEKSMMNALQASIFNAALDGKGALNEVHFAPDPTGEFDGVIDVFGDGSLWAIAVPGHTPGSMAFVARTPNGPVLFTGDACHSAWGWKNGVEPGTFSSDRPKSAVSLQRLEAFAARHPAMQVRLGHQELEGASATGSN